MSYKINSNITQRLIDNELILLNIEKGNFYSLNDTGKFIFENIKNNLSAPQIINELKNNFPCISDINLENDFNELVTDLINEDIIIP